MAVQNPIVLKSDGRKPSVWARRTKRCREANLDDQEELEDCTVSPKELCQQVKKGPFIRCWRLRIPKGFTNERHPKIKVKGKLAPRYVGPFQILDRKGEVSYQLELPPQLSDVHNVFHLS
jgi:hypothetical protein